MSLNKVVILNSCGEYLIAHANYFQECMEYAREIRISQIQLCGIYGKKNADSEVDFKEFEKLSKTLKGIFFADTIENVINSESVYSLKKMERIFFQDVQKFKIDISRFPKIKEFGGVYWKGLHNINKAFSLENIVLRKIPDSNLQRFSELINLKVLHIYSSKTESTEGIEKLPVEKLFLAENKYLKDIHTINELRFLKELRIEKCKLLTDFSFLENTSIIKELSIDNLDSLKFISSMPCLEKISFRNCKDGDMTPLLESKSLKEISFHPNKKHYSHTLKEITGLIEERKMIKTGS